MLFIFGPWHQCRWALAVVHSAIFGAQRCFVLIMFSSCVTARDCHSMLIAFTLSVIIGVFVLFGLARCGLPFSVVDCCSDLNRYVVNHLLIFVSVKFKFFLVGGFAQSSKFVTHAGAARNGSEKVCQMRCFC